MDFHGHKQRGGHDREIGLVHGRPYIRVWRGPGWLPKDKATFNDGKWHNWNLRVQTGKG